MGGGGGRISRGGGLLTYPVLVLLYVPFAELKKYWEGFHLTRRLQGQKRNDISSWSLCLSFCVKNPGMFLFSVSGKGEIFFTVIANTPLAD